MEIALGLELEDGGVHHSSLSQFRDRLLEHDQASYALDMILDHLVQIKLVEKTGKQRIDSTHVIAKVRELSRLELLQETLRLHKNIVDPAKMQEDASPHREARIF